MLVLNGLLCNPTFIVVVKRPQLNALWFQSTTSHPISLRPILILSSHPRLGCPSVVQIFRPNANSTYYMNTLTMSRAIPTAVHVPHNHQVLSQDCRRKHAEAVLISTTQTRRSIQTRNYNTRTSLALLLLQPKATPRRKHRQVPGIHYTHCASPLIRSRRWRDKENFCFCPESNPNSTVVNPRPVHYPDSWHLLDGLRQPHLKRQSVQPVSEQRLKPGTSKIRSLTHSTATSSYKKP
jgi:hypothetical protein